jgi:hypothetical protein
VLLSSCFTSPTVSAMSSFTCSNVGFAAAIRGTL